MIAGGAWQRNPYKGRPERPWIRVRILHPARPPLDIDLIADTGSPCALIVDPLILRSYKLKDGPRANSNLGTLDGGVLHVAIPELVFEATLPSFGGSNAVETARRSSSEFAGIAGLTLLRMMQYGGNGHSFWLTNPQSEAPVIFS
ncbi:MAG: hypothetical protein KY476_24265 [Planctomycetes bacterium]|nr:hypothetical protein [Planctomycetota bacterium]